MRIAVGVERPILPWEKMPWQIRNTPARCPEVSVCRQYGTCSYGRNLVKDYRKEERWQKRMQKFKQEMEEARKARGLVFDPKRLKGT